MTDRITKHVSAMKEYGRKPYLVTADAIPYGEKADYRYMMDTTWHKAQDNEQIVVQSVKKKPYQNSDYQTMEQGYDFPIFTFPRWNFQFDFPNTIYRRKPNSYPTEPTEPTETQTQATGLRWIQCPTSVGASKTYTIIVQNSGITTRNLVGGRLNGTRTTYFPSSFELVKATSNAKGFSISNLIDKGSTTWITLTTSSSARGSYYIYATDRNYTINKSIKVSSALLAELNTSTLQYLEFGNLNAGIYDVNIWSGDYSTYPFDNYQFIINDFPTHLLILFPYDSDNYLYEDITDAGESQTVLFYGKSNSLPYSFLVQNEGAYTDEGTALNSIAPTTPVALL